MSQNTTSQATTPAVVIDENVVVKVKTVKIFAGEDATSATLELDQEIDNIVKKDGDFVLGKSPRMRFTYRSVLTKQLCDVSDAFAEFRGIVAKALDERLFNAVLAGATITVARKLVNEGEVVDEESGEVAEHTFIRDNITKVVFSDKAKQRMDKIADMAIQQSLGL